MRRNGWFAAAVAVGVFSSSTAFAQVSFELLRAPCFTGNRSQITQPDGVHGEFKGAVDCFNEDFNGGGARTTFSIKAFQPWEFGTMFLYYDITGPWVSPTAIVRSDNEKGGFFGGITMTVSPKRVAEKLMGGSELKLPGLRDVEIKYEMEHVSKFGMLHYLGLQWALDVPFMDFLTVTTVVREDFSFAGVDLQLGGAWQKSFSLGSQDFVFGGFMQWGVFGEGAHVSVPGLRGNRFFITQPQLLWDAGKLIQFTPRKIYLGFEWQFALNRYLIEGKTENVLQGMIRWNI